jgi:hypothetical protein
MPVFSYKQVDLPNGPWRCYATGGVYIAGVDCAELKSATSVENATKRYVENFRLGRVNTF